MALVVRSVFLPSTHAGSVRMRILFFLLPLGEGARRADEGVDFPFAVHASERLSSLALIRHFVPPSPGGRREAKKWKRPLTSTKRDCGAVRGEPEACCRHGDALLRRRSASVHPPRGRRSGFATAALFRCPHSFADIRNAARGVSCCRTFVPGHDVTGHVLERESNPQQSVYQTDALTI
jgi:hypothetical protein